MAAAPRPEPLLAVRGLQVAFRGTRGDTTVLHCIDLDVHPGRTVGLVGESGSGKSIAALAILGLLPPRARITAGQLMFEGQDLRAISEARMRALRGRAIGLVFQDPSSALNPIFSIGRQVQEGLRLHLGLRGAAARRRAQELLDLVRIPDAAGCLAKYPHELSGGMRQRVLIAIALACGPRLLIADEPTTALDVTTQAQILALLHDLQARLGMALILITHDLGVIADHADDVAVMYAGRIVEQAPVQTLFHHQAHPYTAGLLHCMPSLDEDDPPELPAIPGMAASPAELPPGCAFHPRCPHTTDPCRAAVPPLAAIATSHRAACLLNAAL